jgi:hypothetical protein
MPYSNIYIATKLSNHSISLREIIYLAIFPGLHSDLAGVPWAVIWLVSDSVKAVAFGSLGLRTRYEAPVHGNA